MGCEYSWAASSHGLRPTFPPAEAAGTMQRGAARRRDRTEFLSSAMLHRLQPPDHRLDASANLLILVQQRSAFRGERLVSLAQRAILFLEVFDRDRKSV